MFVLNWARVLFMAGVFGLVELRFAVFEVGFKFHLVVVNATEKECLKVFC